MRPLKSLNLFAALMLPVFCIAKTVKVRNAGELTIAVASVTPGDTIEMQNGEWHSVTIKLDCWGNTEKPITIKAQTNGKVQITGNSRLLISGEYILIDGLYFTHGFSGTDPVIKFSSGNQVANHCRITNIIIDDFNNPERLNENYWVALYGKFNRIDHCGFYNKKNLGVLMAVILDDDRSRENFHSIDHNFFGIRLPLASNSGEIIRVGVSQHCEFNSNTQITNNYFDHCDGETEVISIKSCSNYAAENFFNECQGGVVLRHGNYNTVTNNIFWGNNKEGTGGVRIINKGQWVVNNFFYKCRGEGFRSPLSVMNGVPNSPANRYVQVTDAVIANNSFVGCTPISFCEGSDKERSLPPANVLFFNNLFKNEHDSLLFYAFDDYSGFRFSANYISKQIQQMMPAGFIRNAISEQQLDHFGFPAASHYTSATLSDSLQKISMERLKKKPGQIPGFNDLFILKTILSSTKRNAGPNWNIPAEMAVKPVFVNCSTPEQIRKQLKKNKSEKLIINLTGSVYAFEEPIVLQNQVLFTGNAKQPVSFLCTNAVAPSLFLLEAGACLKMENLNLNLEHVQSPAFIETDTFGYVQHSKLTITNCRFTNYTGSFFIASKTSILDSIAITNCDFRKGNGLVFNLRNETDKKGFYNVEKFVITNCHFNNQHGAVVSLMRTGTDESTMGPSFTFTNNHLVDCSGNDPLISLYGVQLSFIKNNLFTNCNSRNTVLHYEDLVKAKHRLIGNTFTNSGSVIENKFVQKNK